MTCITRGIVIKKGHSGDFDRQYIIYTSDLGKISAIAKGAKKPTSKLSPHLDLFSSVDLMLAKGAGPYRIASAVIDNSFRSIGESVIKSAASHLFLEALDNLLIYDFPDQRIFRLSENFLVEINRTNSVKESSIVLNRHLFELLSYSGYQPEIKATSQRGLLGEMCKMIIEATEKELKSYNLLCPILKRSQLMK